MSQSTTPSPAEMDRPSRAKPLPKPSAVEPGKIVWKFFFILAGFHVLTLAAFIPYTFSWLSVALLPLAITIFGQGINLCYHRMLTHRSLAVPKWLERSYVVLALCCLEGTPCRWVTTHRHHHKFSDEQEDPHSPFVSFFWSHFQWMTQANSSTESWDAYSKYSKDILADRFYRWIEMRPWSLLMFYLIHAAVIFAFGALVGWLLSGTPSEAVRMGVSMVLWLAVIRTVAVWNITWAINSITHVWGYRTYETSDDSRNNWLFGYVAAGEGWHNNHHGDQASACNSRRWWEFDLTWCHIVVLKSLGLATNVVEPREQREARRAVERAERAERAAAAAETAADKVDEAAPVAAVTPETVTSETAATPSQSPAA